VAVAARQVLGLVHGRWDHSAPECWPPPLTYGEMRAAECACLARCALPAPRAWPLLPRVAEGATQRRLP
jgi:hypothetical protein